ncbi:MAG: RNA 3'-terminal phosphate cyclase [Natronomonas sp.]
MLEIDGSTGGGQIVRTALSLSALSGTAVRIENVRGDRPTPGLRPQHLAAVEAMAALCSATVEGDTVDSETLVFRPEAVTADDVSVDVGTAGSVALVFDTLLPLAVAIDDPATVTVTGGTDTKWAPLVSYLQRVKLPLLSEVGLDAEVTVDSRGFYPAGGGRAMLTLRPSSLSPLSLTDRGSLRRVEVYSTATEELADAEVAERQAAAVAGELDADASVGTEAAFVEADSTGSSVLVVAVYEGTRAGFSALGEAGKPSEEVAAEAVEAFHRFHEGTAVVDRHLADQALVFLALAGGQVLAPELTDHVETNRTVIEAFGYDLTVSDGDGGVLLEG